MGKRESLHAPMYGWAIRKADGLPVPIAAARHGEAYQCPICHGDVIPKKGDVKQHHYAHVSLVDCTPDNVARAVAGIWLLQQLQERLATGKPLTVQWHMTHLETDFSINLLNDITQITRRADSKPDQADLELRHGETVKLIILLDIGEPKDQEIVRGWVRDGRAVVRLNPVGVRSGRMNVDELMQVSELMGGWWLLDESQVPQNLVFDPDDIRKTLREAAQKPPHRFYGELKTEGVMSYVLDIDGKKLWLPPELWNDVVGGSANRLGPNITVRIQEWIDDDNSHIELFYINARKTAAVAIRRYAAHEQVVIRLGNSMFRLGQTEAVDLARELSGRDQPPTLPR